MKKILSILFLGSLFIIAGCEDGFLDRKPYDALSSQGVWDSDETAQLEVTGIYRIANADYCLMSVPYRFSCWGPDGFNYFRDRAIECNSATVYTGNYLNTYRAFYKLIRASNDAIMHLTDNDKITATLRDQLLGQAKFFRGISYFYLWQCFGGVIIMDKVLNSEDTYLPRNSADEVKEFVIKDFTDAASLLPVSYSASEYGKVTRGAAIAMLGKVYLYDKQWDMAVNTFSQLFSAPFSYDLHEDYAQLFDYKWEQNKEVVFSLQEVAETNLGSSYDQWYGSRATNTYAQSYSFASHIPFETYTYCDGTEIDKSTRPKRSDYENEHDYGVDLMAWYDDVLHNHQVDKRLQANIIMPTDTYVGKNDVVYKHYWPYADYANANPPAMRYEFSGYALYAWRKFVCTGNELSMSMRWYSPTDIPLIRFADVLLMYAEAKNEAQGPSQDVYDAVNRVRSRAGVVDLPAGLSKDEMRRYIWLERFHEFPGEGILFFDVRRWGTATSDDPVFGLNHDVLDFRGEKFFTRQFPEKFKLFPIPAAEIDINDKLTQNPGWE